METEPSQRPEYVDSFKANSDGKENSQMNEFNESVGIGGAQFNGDITVNINQTSLGIRGVINEGPKERGQVLDLTINEDLTIEQALEFVKMLNNRLGASRPARLIYIEKGSTHLFLDVSHDMLDRIINLHEEGSLEELLRREEASEQFNICNVEAIYAGRTMAKADLISQIREKGAEMADLIGTNLSGANLKGANFRAANLTGADLSRSKLSGVNLREANLREANLFNAALIRADISGANLIDSDLGGAKLFNADLSNTDLTRANLRMADLGGANLRCAKLFDAILIRADLAGAEATSAKLSWSDLSNANLSGANLEEVTFFDANLSGASLRGAFLSRAKFGGADLSGAVLVESELSMASLIHANLRGADLSRSNLYKANLVGANLEDANFSESILTLCRFGSSRGLTKEQQADMRRRGALFMDSPESDFALIFS
jgi:uncharacterized protein YjbI with pentapeptide repeats